MKPCPPTPKWLLAEQWTLQTGHCPCVLGVSRACAIYERFGVVTVENVSIAKYVPFSIDGCAAAAAGALRGTGTGGRARALGGANATGRETHGRSHVRSNERGWSIVNSGGAKVEAKRLRWSVMRDIIATVRLRCAVAKMWCQEH